MTITREHKTAWLAISLSVLIASLLLAADAGLGNAAGASLITYVVTVVIVAVKVPLELTRVVAATGRGTIVVAVVLVLFLTSVGRSLAAVVS
ncbi:hypothetical protein [Streptomyces sp. NPDC059513]|uniref:hypothetical protein n=1 Tax=unclassified Streptomyces TaxID=2593676 RepID=UPI00369D3B79